MDDIVEDMILQTCFTNLSVIKLGDVKKKKKAEQAQPEPRCWQNFAAYLCL